jgi:hypothetical protein
MAELRHTELIINDDGGGAPTRSFNFDTFTEGDKIRVEITFPGSGPLEVKLSEQNPKVLIPETNARVKPTGKLQLEWDNDTSSHIILFTGTLETTHSAEFKNVCVGVVDHR